MQQLQAAAPPLIPAPSDATKREAWHTMLDALHKNGDSPAMLRAYGDAQFKWMRGCLVCGLAMLFDRELFDPMENRFRVDEYVQRNRRDFGALDGVLLWQAYPRIGIDTRNQFDHYRLAPNLKQAIQEFHRLGVRVFMAYNPWDSGTRREPKRDARVLAEMVAEFGFDGIFLDTLAEGAPALRKELDTVGSGLTIESEDALPVEGIATHHASWAQWFDDSEAPGVLRNRWIERGHMMHTIRRWDLDHTNELHMSWMNGVGILVWENVFGSWNGWSDRDKAILRSMIAIRKRFAVHFDSGEWTPIVPCTLDDVYGSKWSNGVSSLWTFVNRRWDKVRGSVLPISSDGTTRLFDLIRGIELDHAELEIEGRWVGALLAIPASAVDEPFQAFLSEQAKAYRPDASPFGRIEPAASRCAETPFAPKTPPAGFFQLSDGDRVIVSEFRARECGEYAGAPFPNFAYPPLHFTRSIEQRSSIGRVAVASREVTNREYQSFVAAGVYKPKISDSYLSHWSNGTPTPTQMDEPVTFVSLEDARAYCRWAKMRLPTELEWQLAMSDHPSAHGSVWNWTESERFDGHTRFSILKGGSKLVVAGSDWYADSGPHGADWSAKYIHFYTSLDRSESIGFRCAVDG